MSGDTKREVEELRQEIAKIDAQLLVLLEKRAKTARKVGELRKDHALASAVADRAAISSLVARASGDMPVEALREIFREIFASCLALELPTPVAFVGLEGGACHAAARGRFGFSAKYVATESAALALEEVVRQRAQFAVVPFETRAEGPVQSTILALTSSDLKIVACFEVASNLQLVNRTGNAGDIEKVFATAADRAICQRSLAQAAPKARVMDVKTPLLACQLAMEDQGAAALATEAFAAQHQLEVALRNVRDEGDDRVRYALVAPRPSSRSGNDLTALVMSVHDSPGALHEVLKHFAERGINLTKIQSRPTSGEAWQYLFFVEVVGHATDRTIVAALEDVRRLTKFFKVLGSYQAA